MASAHEVDMLRRQLDEFTAQMIDMRQQSSSTAMNAAVSGLAEAVRTMGHKDVDDWDFTFNGYEGTPDPAYLALLKTARQSPTVVMANPPHEQQSATFAVPTHHAHTERSTESSEKSWKQPFRSLQTIVPDVRNDRSGRQHGTIRANHDIQVRFQD